MNIPTTTLDRALQRVDSIWHPEQAPHALIYAATGAGKSTLIKRLLGLNEHERVVLVEPKRSADPAYTGPDDEPWRWGRPVERLTPRFGHDGERGGGPHGMWFRIVGSPDRADTAKRFAAGLDTIADEGSTVLVLDDVKECSKTLGLADQIGSILNLGRSSGLLCVLATTETSYVAGRSQGSMVFAGFTGGHLPAAKAGAELLGWRGRERQDYLAALKRYHWVMNENEEGSAGPVLVTP